MPASAAASRPASRFDRRAAERDGVSHRRHRRDRSCDRATERRRARRATFRLGRSRRRDGAAHRSSHSPTACMTARARRRGDRGTQLPAGSAKNRSGRPMTGAPGPRERDSGVIFPVSRRSVPQCDGTGLWQGLCLSCGTSLERIAPESLTRALSEFVHGHISCHHHIVPPDRVAGSSLSQSNELPSVKIEPIALQCGG
jgi:hypothetical protein